MFSVHGPDEDEGRVAEIIQLVPHKRSFVQLSFETHIHAYLRLEIERNDKKTLLKGESIHARNLYNTSRT